MLICTLDEIDNMRYRITYSFDTIHSPIIIDCWNV